MQKLFFGPEMEQELYRYFDHHGLEDSGSADMTELSQRAPRLLSFFKPL